MSIKTPESILNKIISRGRTFRYPDNITSINDNLHHFMIIKEFSYKEEERNSDVITNAISKTEGLTSTTDFYNLERSFVLPLPQGEISTSYSATYEENEIGFFGKVLENNIGELTDNISQYFGEYQKGADGWLGKTAEFYANVGKDVYEIGKNVYDQVGQKDVANKVKMNVATAVGGLASIFSDAKGDDIAALSMRNQRNPYTSLVFAGNRSKRSHSFNFKFVPRDADESKNLIKLITNLKLGMLPSLPKLDGVTNRVVVDNPAFEDMPFSMKSQVPEQVRKIPKTFKNINQMNSLLFNFPNVYTITFYDVNNSSPYVNKYLFRIGQSVLTSLKVKNSNIFFEDTGLPVEIDLSLEFKENFALHRDQIDEGY